MRARNRDFAAYVDCARQGLAKMAPEIQAHLARWVEDATEFAAKTA